MQSDRRTIRLVPKQDHDRLLDLTEALPAVHTGYQDRADDSKWLRQRIVDPERDTRMSNVASLLLRPNAGGILFFSK